MTASAIFDSGSIVATDTQFTRGQYLFIFVIVRADPNRPTVDYGTRDGSTRPKNMHKSLFSIEVSPFLF